MGTFIKSFAINELISEEKFKSLLFYLGFTTIKDISLLGIYSYKVPKVPNKLIETLVWEFIQKSLTDRRFMEYVKYNYFIDLKYLKASDIDIQENEENAIKETVEKAKNQLKQYAANEKFTTIKIIIVASTKKMLYMDSIE